MIKVGAYAFELTSKKANANSYVYVQIDSKCRDEQTLPFQTKCWTSSGINQNFRFTVVLKANNICIIIPIIYISGHISILQALVILMPEIRIADSQFQHRLLRVIIQFQMQTLSKYIICLDQYAYATHIIYIYIYQILFLT